MSDFKRVRATRLGVALLGIELASGIWPGSAQAQSDDSVVILLRGGKTRPAGSGPARARPAREPR